VISRKKWRSILIQGFLYILIILIGFARIYLGVQNYGQILLGWIYSAYFLIIVNSGVFEMIKQKMIIMQ
jgi:hypothetical protein